MPAHLDPSPFASVQRTHLRGRAAVVAHGDFEPLFTALEQHLDRWKLPVDPLGLTMLRQGLATLGLHISSRPRDEVVGVTLSVQNPPVNLFLGADANRGALTGRVYSEGVEEYPENRLFVQTRRRKGDTSQSVLDVVGLDLPLIFEQLHARSEQFPSRFFDYDDGRFAMVQALPGVDEAWLQALDRVQVEQLFGSGDALDERGFLLDCGCDEERMRVAMQGMFENNLEELFQGEEQLEVLCPRCGRSWDLRRADLKR